MGHSDLKLATTYMMQADKLAVKTLRNYIEERGGIINTSNADGDKDGIFAYVWTYNDDYPVEEANVNCIMVDEKSDNIYMHCTQYPEDYEDFSEIKDDNDNWIKLWYDECILGATLYSILESIDEYVEDD